MQFLISVTTAQRVCTVLRPAMSLHLLVNGLSWGLFLEWFASESHFSSMEVCQDECWLQEVKGMSSPASPSLLTPPRGLSGQLLSFCSCSYHSRGFLPRLKRTFGITCSPPRVIAYLIKWRQDSRFILILLYVTLLLKCEKYLFTGWISNKAIWHPHWWWAASEWWVTPAKSGQPLSADDPVMMKPLPWWGFSWQMSTRPWREFWPPLTAVTMNLFVLFSFSWLSQCLKCLFLDGLSVEI